MLQAHYKGTLINNTKMKDWMFLVIAAVFIWYVVIGGIVFTVLESGFEEKIRLHTKQYKQNWLSMCTLYNL